jgi:hypothetical protein
MKSKMPNDMTTLCGIKRNFLYGISIAIYDEEKLLVSSNNAYGFDLGCIEVDIHCIWSHRFYPKLARHAVLARLMP